MQGIVYLKHKISNPGPTYQIEGDLRWYSNSIMRVVAGEDCWEIPAENIAAVIFKLPYKAEVKHEKKEAG